MKQTPNVIATTKAPLLIYLVAILVIIFLQWNYQNTIREHAHEFRENVTAEAQTLGHNIAHKIEMLYQSLRTIARLSGTRSIDRYGENFDADARATLQELYNNLYTNISLSEIYIIHKDFDPDKTDPTTKELKKPIITFDEFIIGRHAEKNDTDSTLSPLEEIEIYEYRLMRDQLSWLKENFPTEASIIDLNYPAISGPEVTTCDNTLFSPSNPNEKDRAGLVYSVPFYNNHGTLEGIISGVVLTRVLQKLIPNGNYAIINTDHDYFIPPISEGSWQQSVKQIKNGSPNKSLFFSEVINLPITDKDNGWKLWVGRPMNDFYNSEEIINYNRNKYALFIIVIIFAIGIHIIIFQQRKRRQFIINQNEYLEKNIRERTQALTLTNEQLVKANDAKANFLSRVSHELRTPLNAIIGYSDLLLDEDLKDEELAKKDIKKINDSGTHLLSLINEVLDISKIEAGKMELHIEPINVEDLLEEVIATTKPLAEKNGNELTMFIADDINTITTDRLKVKQILINLLANACKFTNSGKISLSIKTDDQEGSEIIFGVTDTGIGIEAKKLEYIFDEFYQAHDTSPDMDAGTGLGLPISIKLATLLGGNIQANSQPQNGSTFSLTLPKHINTSKLPSDVVMANKFVQMRNPE